MMLPGFILKNLPNKIIGTIIIFELVMLGAVLASGHSKNEPQSQYRSLESKLPTYSPTVQGQSTYEADPVVNCGPGVNSGQYIKDKASKCQYYVDCGFIDGSWKLMSESACTKAQAADAAAHPTNSNSNNNANNYIDCYLAGKTYKVTAAVCSDATYRYYQAQSLGKSLNSGVQSIVDQAEADAQSIANKNYYQPNQNIGNEAAAQMQNIANQQPMTITNPSPSPNNCQQYAGSDVGTDAIVYCNP